MNIEQLQAEINKIWWRPWQSKESIFIRKLLKHMKNAGSNKEFNGFKPKELFDAIDSNDTLKQVLKKELDRRRFFGLGKPVFKCQTMLSVIQTCRNTSEDNLTSSTSEKNDTTSSTSTSPTVSKLSQKELLKIFSQKKESHNYSGVPDTDNSKNHDDKITESSSKKTCFSAFCSVFFGPSQTKVHPFSDKTAESTNNKTYSVTH